MKKLTRNVDPIFNVPFVRGGFAVVFLFFLSPVVTQKQLFALIIKSPV